MENSSFLCVVNITRAPYLSLCLDNVHFLSFHTSLVLNTLFSLLSVFLIVSSSVINSTTLWLDITIIIFEVFLNFKVNLQLQNPVQIWGAKIFIAYRKQACIILPALCLLWERQLPNVSSSMTHLHANFIGRREKKKTHLLQGDPLNISEDNL